MNTGLKSFNTASKANTSPSMGSLYEPRKLNMVSVGAFLNTLRSSLTIFWKVGFRTMKKQSKNSQELL
jgi:hypothetical protein